NAPTSAALRHRGRAADLSRPRTQPRARGARGPLAARGPGGPAPGLRDVRLDPRARRGAPQLVRSEGRVPPLGVAHRAESPARDRRARGAHGALAHDGGGARDGHVLDTFVPAPTPVFEEAVSVSASFAATVHTQDSLLDLMFVGPEAYVFTAGRGVGHVDRMLEVLAEVRPCPDRDFAALHRLVVERHSLLSGLVCVLV